MQTFFFFQIICNIDTYDLKHAIRTFFILIRKSINLIQITFSLSLTKLISAISSSSQTSILIKILTRNIILENDNTRQMKLI